MVYQSLPKGWFSLHMYTSLSLSFHCVVFFSLSDSCSIFSSRTLRSGDIKMQIPMVPVGMSLIFSIKIIFYTGLVHLLANMLF